MIKDRFGQIIHGINSYRLGKPIGDLSADDQLICSFEFAMSLGKGNYSITTGISKMDSHLSDNYEWRDGGFVFSVLNTQKRDFVGCVALCIALSIQHISSGNAAKKEDAD